MRGDLQINGNKVFKNGKELKGFEKVLWMMFGYIIAAIVLVAVAAIILLVGGVVTVGVPLIIGFVLLCIVVSFIIGLVKMIFR